MLVEQRAIESIKPYDRNPRRNDAAVDAVARSITDYGFRQPIVLDKDGVIVVGHTRWKAALKLGLKLVPVHVAAELTEAQARAYRIADNATASISTWNDELLPAELADLKALDIDIRALGFSAEELAEWLAPPACELTGADDPVEPAKEAVTRAGDLWTLDRHRLLCGDSTNPEHVQRVMDGQKAALVATDPPYLVEYSGERPNDSGKDWSATYHEIDITDADGFFRAVFTNILAVAGEGAAFYCWHAHKRQALIAKVWEDLGIVDHQQVVWVKPASVFGRVYWHFRHEPCMMGWRQGSQPPHDGKHEFDSVWEIDWAGKARFTGEHPTTKPVEIFARPMRKHTKRGAVCFEPFSGSGSQIIAAEQLSRRCHAIEIEPVFVDVAVRRWQTLTGQDAVLEATGRTWRETAAERGVVVEESKQAAPVAAGAGTG